MNNNASFYIMLICVWFIFMPQSKAAEFVYDDSGALIVIENAESTEYTYESDGSIDIKIEPSQTERTYIYGADELTIIQPSPLGTFTY